MRQPTGSDSHAEIQTSFFQVFRTATELSRAGLKEASLLIGWKLAKSFRHSIHYDGHGSVRYLANTAGDRRQQNDYK
jgi:hypothetical protein